MAVNKVDLYVSQILEDLDNGLTWLKRDDIGYGSIQEKYNAKEQQIAVIRKGNAKLRDAETNITVFNIIDDTKDEGSTTTLPANGQSNDTTLETKEPAVERTSDNSHGQTVSVVAEPAAVEADTDSFSAFANL